MWLFPVLESAVEEVVDIGNRGEIADCAAVLDDWLGLVIDVFEESRVEGEFFVGVDWTC